MTKPLAALAALALLGLGACSSDTGSSGSSSTPTSPTELRVNPAEASALLSDVFSTRSNEIVTPSRLPTSGRATYDGFMVVRDLRPGSDALGELRTVVDFSSSQFSMGTGGLVVRDSSGRGRNVQGSVQGTGQVNRGSGNGMEGRITGSIDSVPVNLNLIGQFRTRDGRTIDAVGGRTVSGSSHYAEFAGR